MEKITSILVASDLSEESDEVVRAAGEIARATGATVHLLNAFDLPPEASVRKSTAPVTFAQRIEEAEQRLDEQIRRGIPEGVSVGSRRVEVYVAHKAILDGAVAVAADLIVVGPHGRRRFGDDVLGGTADRVIRSAEVPCLVARGTLSLPLRRIVAPVDRSAAATAALEVAIGWGVLLGGGDATELDVEHILPEAMNIPELGIDPDRIVERLGQEVQEVVSRVPGAESLNVVTRVRWGQSAVEEITRLAGENHADLVVIGTHGHGPLRRFLIGSVASGVARRAPCSVLLVPPAMWRQERQRLSGADAR
ncbi:MAG TPA: universal stress protein [Longimicrobiaceae bacterium]